ncbi:Os01g0818800, partial [Oryza sativa Japonica Group]
DRDHWLRPSRPRRPLSRRRSRRRLAGALSPSPLAAGGCDYGLDLHLAAASNSDLSKKNRRAAAVQEDDLKLRLVRVHAGMGQCNLVPSFSSFFSLNFCVVFLIETHRAILER